MVGIKVRRAGEGGVERVSKKSQLPAQEGLKAKWSTHMPVAFSVHVWRQAQSLWVSKEAGVQDSRRSHRVDLCRPGYAILLTALQDLVYSFQVIPQLSGSLTIDI